MVMLTKELQKTLNFALIEATSRRHEYLTLEHLLLALLSDSTAKTVLRHCGCDLKKLKQDLEIFFTDNL